MLRRERKRGRAADPDKRVFILAPFLSVVPAFLVFSVIPIGGNFDGDKQGVVHLFGHDTYLQLADPPIGVLWTTGARDLTSLTRCRT